MGIGNFLIVQDEIQPSDVIHVISGPNYRAEYAIQLYKKGYAKYVFFTGGWCIYHQVNHAEYGKESAIRQGVPEWAVITNEESITSTYQEAGKLKDWFAHSPEPITSVIVVSDPFHMRRARWTYCLLFGNQFHIFMAPVPFELTPYQQKWWTNSESRRYVRTEYSKFAYYWLRYKLKWAPIQDWLASLDRE